MALDIVQVRGFNNLEPPESEVARTLLEDWDPENIDKLDYWVFGRNYVLSWQSKANGHVLRFRRNWMPGEPDSVSKELVYLEAIYLDEDGTLRRTDDVSVLFSGLVNAWTYLGPLSHLYHTQDELDAWRALRDKRENS